MARRRHISRYLRLTISGIICIAVLFYMMSLLYKYTHEDMVGTGDAASGTAEKGDNELYNNKEQEAFTREEIVMGTTSKQASAEDRKLKISEVMSSNSSTLRDDDGDYPSWIEIYNSGDISINLEGYGLSDRKGNPHKWTFPDVTIEPGEYMVVFASGKDRHDANKQIVHTNFGISSLGEPVVLSDRNKRIIDEIYVGRLPKDVSFGRTLNSESQNWVYYTRPTPGKENAAESYKGFAPAPWFVKKGGFYSGSVYLDLETKSEQTEIRYTLDGSVPDSKSPVYTSPILIEKTTVVRARAYGQGLLPSPVETHTFFIDVSHVLPVVSVSIDPVDFDDPVHGIYSDVNKRSNTTENPAHLELFESGGKLGFRMDCGLKLFGGGTRVFPKKSFAVYARNRYEYEEMTYPFLENKGVVHYKHLVLRTSGQDMFNTKIRDIMMTTLMQDTNLDYQGYRQTVLYINGQYWGIYNIREKINRYFIANNHDIDDLDTIDIMERDRSIKAGERDHYAAMMDFAINNDLSRKENYEFMKTQMDMLNYIDWNIAQIYFANRDLGNIRYWRERVPDAKWRWILFDLDLGFGWGRFVHHDSIAEMMHPAGRGGDGHTFSTALIRNLWVNDEFRDEFVQRFAYHMNNTFEPERVIALIDELAANIEPEMPMNVERWKGTHNLFPNTVEQWHSRVDVLRNFAERRPEYMVQHIKKHFGLTDQEMRIFDAWTE